MTGPRMSTDAVAENVRRLLAGEYQYTLQERAGWHRVYFSDRMRGRVGWSVADLVTLCELLDVDPRELLTPVDGERPADPLGPDRVDLIRDESEAAW